MPPENKPLVSDQQIAAIRTFNRFYTREIGLLRKTFLGTAWTLGEMRVLYEIGIQPGITAVEIGQKLDLDAAYLSRLIRKFRSEGLLRRTPSETDARSFHLELTQAGISQVDQTNAQQIEQTRAILSALSETDRNNLIESMKTIERLMARESEN